MPLPIGSKRGNGCGSVLHSMAVSCWIISAKASVDSTYRCWSKLFRTGRTVTTSVMMPISAPAASVARKPTNTGRPNRLMNNAPNTPPSMPTIPAVKLNTREAENMTL